jgi:putative FmdB family regulatory protein
MPIYEYRCTACGHELEKLQKISDPPLTDCPACGQASLTKLVSAAAFRLKGGGWYETDFKKDGKRNLAGEGDAKEGAAKDDGGKDKAKSDGAADKPAKTTKDSSSSDGGGKKSETNASSSSSGKAA